MKKILLILAVVLPVLFSCQKQTGTGTLSLSITDSPIDSSNVSGVFITVTKIMVNTGDSGWVTMTNFSGPQTFNLIDLTRGKSSLLGSVELPSGNYSQIRFMIDAPEKGTPRPTSPGCYVEYKDGVKEPLFVPSGAQTGFKATGTFSVPSNGTVNMAADFDVRKSVHVNGGSSRLILSPVIRLVVTNQAGSITGHVTNIPADSSVVIYAYKSGSYNSSEAATPASSDVSRFPNAVTSDKADTAGVYHLAFLAPGNYDLVVTTAKDGVFGRVAGVVSGVAVTSNATTTKDIDMSKL